MIIVPTKYYKTPTPHFHDIGVSTIIWANHNMRAAISAMQATTKRIYEDQSLVNVEEEVGESPAPDGVALPHDDYLLFLLPH